MNPSTIRQSPRTVFGLTTVLWAAAVLAIGAFLGWWIAYVLSAPDYGFGRLSAYFIAALAGVILATLAVIAVVAALWPGQRGRPAARVAIVIGLLFAAGVGLGWAITPVVGLGYREPVYLEARGTMNLSLEGLAGYVSQGDQLALCSRVDHTQVVGHVEAIVGSVPSGRVAASVSIVPAAPDGWPSVAIAIQPTVEPKGSGTAWYGPAEVVERRDGNRTGRVTFSSAVLIADEHDGRLPEGRPAELSGTLSWSCGDWVPAT